MKTENVKLPTFNGLYKFSNFYYFLKGPAHNFNHGHNPNEADKEFFIFHVSGWRFTNKRLDPTREFIKSPISIGLPIVYPRDKFLSEFIEVTPDSELEKIFYENDYYHFTSMQKVYNKNNAILGCREG